MALSDRSGTTAFNLGLAMTLSSEQIELLRKLVDSRDGLLRTNARPGEAITSLVREGAVEAVLSSNISGRGRSGGTSMFRITERGRILVEEGMYTDAPEEIIISIETALQANGYDATVLRDASDQRIRALGSQLFEAARKIIDREMANQDSSAQVYYCSILDPVPTYQACAFKIGENTFCIAVWMSVPIRLLNVVSHLLQTQPLAEHFRLQGPPFILRDNPIGSDPYSSYDVLTTQMSFESSYPQFRTELVSAAFEWMVLHELAHVLNGHLALGAQSGELSYIIEHGAPASHDDNLTSHALEMDADAFATKGALNSCLQIPSIAESLGSYSSTEVETLRLGRFFTAVAALVRGFDYELFDPSTIFDSDHPPGVVREATCSGLIATMWLEGFMHFESDPIPGLVTISVNFDRAVEHATGAQGFVAAKLKAHEMDWSSYHAVVAARWAEIYPTLMAAKLRKGNLAFPRMPE